MERFLKIGILWACVLLMSLSVAVAASPLSDATQTASRSVSDGLQLTETTASAQDRPVSLYAVTADPARWQPVIGGGVQEKALVQNMTPHTSAQGAVAAALNGDHFSFQTGIPMGMSVSDGEILTSPVEAYNADEYYFHALGICADGTVLTGENPTLYMQYEIGEHTASIDRINRTRENWEGGQVCLFTPAYGDSTGTNPAGVEFILRVDEGRVAAGSPLKGTIVAIDEDGDAPIEEGHVVLSISLLQYSEIERLALGDQLQFFIQFKEEKWNEVTFAVGGNMTAVENGKAIEFDYTTGTFASPQPRSAFGVKADGTLVLAAADGRSEISEGLTANEMAAYMAEDMGCEYAILLDGGGSTALAAADENGTLQTVNVPSEERPVGNGVLLVERPAQEDTSQDGGFDWTILLWGVIALGGAVIVVGAVILCKK